jgi:hypothetical protein
MLSKILSKQLKITLDTSTGLVLQLATSTSFKRPALFFGLAVYKIALHNLLFPVKAIFDYDM